MNLWAPLLLFFLVCTASSQRLQPLMHVEACSKFSDAVVQVMTDQMSGTGFVVGADGWVITALHVVADPHTFSPYDNLRVFITGHQIPAEIVSPLDKLAGTRDFAIVKIAKTQLPKLDLGVDAEIQLGSPISIIGFPLSAIFPRTAAATVVPRFCLTGTVAAQTSLPLGNLNFLHTIYFQGVSVKGISGAPIISLQTGKVIGIVTTRLTGITDALADLHKQIVDGRGGRISISGFEPGPDVDKIITVLDTQLANGLGSGTGASDAAYTLKAAQRDYQQAHPQK